MSINKVIYDGNTLIDLTDDTVDSSTLLSGYTAHNRSGDSITGTFDTGVFVLKAGDTMTGALTLSGAPTSNLHAATKKYVDDSVGAIKDENVKQTVTTSNSTYPVLFSQTSITAGNEATTTTAQARISGGIFFNPSIASLAIRRIHTATATAYGRIVLGNSIADGTAGASHGELYVYGKGAYYGRFVDAGGTDGAGVLTANRNYYFPNKSGTIALLGDITDAVNALDGSISGSAGAGKTLTAFSQTNGVVSATFGNISITKSQVSDFPTLATVATSGSYNDLSNKPTITDENVKQTGLAGTEQTAYRILLSSNSNDTTITAGTNKIGALRYTPYYGWMTVDKYHDGTASSSAGISIGNATVDGVSGSTYGILRIYGKGEYYSQISAASSTLTDNRTLTMPDQGGTIAVTSDITNAINALDGSVSGSAGSGKTLTVFSQTNGVVSATFSNISITKSQVSDFPSLATVATSGSYNDLTNKPTITDANVLQSPLDGSETTSYRVLLSNNGSDSATTSNANKISGLIYNPSYGWLTVDKLHSTTGSSCGISIGNSKASGTTGSSYGYLRIYGNTDKYAQIGAIGNSITENRTLSFPDQSGTIAITADITNAINALDGSITGSAGSGKTLTAFSQTNGVVTATFGNISITKSQVSDFPSLATVATSGSYDDLTNKPTITDENVKQTKTTSATSANYSVLLTNSSITANSDPSTTTEGARISGGLFFNPYSGSLSVRKIHTSTDSQSSRIIIGNGIADQTANSSYGEILLYSKGTTSCTISMKDASLSASRTLMPADVSGTIACLEHVYSINGRIASLPIKDSNNQNITNLNNAAYTKPGKYYCNATVAATLTNSPITDTAFIMTVENTTGSGMGAMTDTASSYRRRFVYGAYNSGLMYVQICYTNSSNVESYGAWARYTNDARAVLLTGGTMTGALTLSGAPTSNLHAATKKYVDDAVSGLSGTVTSVALSGSSGISISGSPITTSGTITVSVSTANGSGTRNTTNVSSGTLTYRRYGKVVVITGSCYPASSLSASKTLFSGLPKAKEETIIIASSGDLSDAKAASLYVDTSGVLKTKQSSTSTSILYISGAYICE